MLYNKSFVLLCIVKNTLVFACFSRLIRIRNVQAADLEVRAHLVDDVQCEVHVGDECECAVTNEEVVLIEQRAANDS